MSNLSRSQIRTGAIVGVLTAAGLFAILGWPMKVPYSAVLQAMFPAMAAGLTAVSLVLIYRTVRIVNWAQLALGSITAQLFFEFYTRQYMPYVPALVVAIAIGALVAAVIGLISAALFFKHPRLVMTVVTILMVGFITSISQQIDSAIHANDVVKTIPVFLGPYPNLDVVLAGVPFRIAHLVGFGLMLFAAIALAVFFRRTRVGTAIRASAENSDRAALLGINVKLLQIGIWTIAGVISSIAAVAVQPVQQYAGITGLTDYSELLLPLTAAVVARMTSMPVAFFTAIGMVVLRQSISYATGVSALLQIMTVVVLLGSMLIQKKRIFTRADDTTSWKAVKEVRSTPREMLKIPSIRRARYAIFAILAAVLGVIPWIVGSNTALSVTRLWAFAIIGLSLVVLTGWSGQISLGQFAFAAVGAFVGGRLRLWGVPFLIMLPIAGLAGALFATLVGIPALRIRGLFLAVTTFAIAVIMPLFLFDEEYLGRWAPTQDVTKPHLFVSFSQPQRMYYIALLLFVATLLSVQALRKSRAGRVLIALRDNEAGVQSFGIDVVRTRLMAFAISGFLASFAGGLLIVIDGGMDRATYSAAASIQVFIIIVIGGVSSVMGAVMGAAYFIASILFFPGLQQVLTGTLGLVILMAIPGGLTQIVYGVRDAVLRVVAMRRNIIVPTLFADYSPEAWEKRLAPLAPAVQSQGIGALNPEQRYTLKSRIFGEAPV